MSLFRQKIKTFLLSEDGPTAVEYAIMLALIILTAIGAVLTAGGIQRDMYDDIVTSMDDAIN